MMIRWLGAFRKKASLKDSLLWELRGDTRAVAAEWLRHGKSKIRHARVGLLVKNSAVLRRYESDVWSEYRENGILRPNRKQNGFYEGHREAFVRPIYIGIVVKGKISDHAVKVVREVAGDNDLPLLRLTRDGRLVDYV